MGMGLIGLLIVGALAGWLATTVLNKEGYGLWANLVIGIVGAFLGGWLFRLIGFDAWGMIANLIVAFIGALILLWIIDFVKKKK
jgi:uncharacterized membrane protein YeaQ/YmgE (transglycosylase-associated protein family)